MDKLNSDLLMVVLAILTDAVPQPALAQAVKLWADHPGQSLTHWLKTSAGLDDTRIRALECLAATQLRAHEHDFHASLNACNGFDLTQDVLTEVNDDALRTTVGATLGGNETLPLGAGPTDGALAGLSHPQPRAAGVDRFQLIRPHARGGIGQVWVARDTELQREVALKEIQPRFAESASQRARFVLEAEITGNLEHPGIVPVYSLGRNAEGRPYYAMRFIRGESFSAAIRQFHKSRPEQGEGPATGAKPSWGIEFRQLLRRFLDVCDAMDYAHSRGVLHRDLKPANIMLGRYGETLVVDWGLAKLIGMDDVTAERGDGEFEPTFAGASVTTSGETAEGTTIGTPAYMSPEQARGAIDQLGPGSDVYSLGATLYELLTGVVPFPGDQVAKVIDKVMKGDFPRPRSLDRSIPAALEAVCLKALANDPGQRYLSVGALAQDLEHWLADEPVTAYTEDRLERLGRWLRQHRTWTYAAVAALVGISLAASIGVFVVDGARRREAAVREEAEKNFAMAQAAVEDYLTSVSENTLLKQQDSVDIRGLRQELLNNALTYYKNFVNQRGDDPGLRRQLANAYYRVGQITQEIGTAREAIEAFQSALAIWKPLADADPRDHALRGRLADCHLAISKQHFTTDSFQAAMTSLDEARIILESLVTEHPDVAAYQEKLAECYLRTGIIQTKLKAADQAIRTLERAKALQYNLSARRPGLSGDQMRLAEIILAMGFLFYERKDYPAALESFQNVQKICRSLLDNITVGPTPVRLLTLLAVSLYNTATIQLEQHQLKEARQSLEQSLEYRSALVKAHPSVWQYQNNLGKTLSEIARLQKDTHQLDLALASSRQSIGVLEKLVQSQPDQPRYRHDLARSWNILGSIHDEGGENELAIEAFSRAIAEESRAVAESSEVEGYKSELCSQLDNLAWQLRSVGRVDESLARYREEIMRWRELVTASPKTQEYVLALADRLVELGNVERHAGDSAAARRSFAQARDALATDSPADAPIAGRLAAALALEATALVDLKQPQAALPLLERSVDILSRAVAAPDADDPSRERLSESLWELARVLRSLGEPARANQRDRERSALWNKQNAAKLARLALAQATRASMIGLGKTPLGDGARAVRELDLAQAAANLRQAIELGFSDLGMLNENRAAAMLLGRADLQPFIKRLESPRPSPLPASPPR